MSTTKKTPKNTETKTIETKETTGINISPVMADALESVASGAKEAVDLAVKTSNEVTAKGYEQAVTVASQQIEAASKAGRGAFKSGSYNGHEKGYEDVLAFHRGNFDAVVEATNAWVNGVQDLNRVWGAFASKSVEQGTASTRQFINCKSVEDLLALNSEAVKSSCDSALVDVKTLNEVSTRLVETSTKPLATRVNETVAQFSKPLAA